MFDVKLRDKLLFEDQDFTYSRRYFWAYNTLGVINDGIKSMRAAYVETFNDDFWAGRNRTIWPYPYTDTALKAAYEKLMLTARHDLEKAVLELDTMERRNEQTRNEIFSLREQLFSGSSVRESRRAIEQGDNIKILTGVSMLFLPLTFVTVCKPLPSSSSFLSSWITLTRYATVRLRHHDPRHLSRRLAFPAYHGNRLRPILHPHLLLTDQGWYGGAETSGEVSG